MRLLIDTDEFFNLVNILFKNALLKGYVDVMLTFFLNEICIHRVLIHVSSK